MHRFDRRPPQEEEEEGRRVTKQEKKKKLKKTIHHHNQLPLHRVLCFSLFLWLFYCNPTSLLPIGPFPLPPSYHFFYS